AEFFREDQIVQLFADELGVRIRIAALVSETGGHAYMHHLSPDWLPGSVCACSVQDSPLGSARISCQSAKSATARQLFPWHFGCAHLAPPLLPSVAWAMFRARHCNKAALRAAIVHQEG